MDDKISNDLLDAMLVGVKTQDDLWGKEGIITQLNKALDTDVGRVAGNTRNGYGKKTIKSKDNKFVSRPFGSREQAR